MWKKHLGRSLASCEYSSPYSGLILGSVWGRLASFGYKISLKASIDPHKSICHFRAQVCKLAGSSIFLRGQYSSGKDQCFLGAWHAIVLEYLQTRNPSPIRRVLAKQAGTRCMFCTVFSVRTNLHCRGEQITFRSPASLVKVWD